MREVNVKLITEKVRTLCIEANTDLGEDVLQALDRAIDKEESPLGIEILKELKENARIAKDEQVAICQDTGFAVVFLEMEVSALTFSGLVAGVSQLISNAMTIPARIYSHT